MKLFLLTTCLFLVSLSAGMDIVVPAYFYPAGKGLSYWNNLTATASSGTPLTVIINPDSGPGTSIDSTYVTVNNNLRNAGASTIGYVFSSYGARPYVDFVADITNYLAWYAVDGFFIDEMSDNANSTIVNYYLSLYNYIKGINSSFIVINNPGTRIPQTFLTTRVADRFVIFEDKQKSYNSYSQPSWQGTYTPDNFIHIVYNTTAAQYTSDIIYANSKGIGGIYITDDKGTNPYDTLPSYWNGEVAAVQNITMRHSMISFTIFEVAFLLFPLTFSQETEVDYWYERGRVNLEKKLEKYSRLMNYPLPKNVILFVGNGLGTTSLTFGMIYKAEKEQRIGRYAEKPLFFDSFPSNAVVKTSSLDRHTTSSEAAMTAILTGRKVEDETIGQPGDCKKGFTSENLLELAIRKKQKEIGLVTNMGLTFPSSAAVYARGIGSSNEDTDLCSAASQLLQFPASEFKVILGGGRQKLTGKGNVFTLWKELGGARKVITSPEELASYQPNGEKILGVLAENNVELYARQKKTSRLAEMTRVAIKTLEKKNKNGYILLINSGSVEEALEENKARLAGEEILEFEEAIEAARNITKKEETLLIVTATNSHSITLPGYLTKDQSLFKSSNNIGIVFLAGPGGNRSAQYTDKEAGNLEFISPALYNTKKGNKAGDDVPLYADGPWSWIFTGSLENIEIAYRLKYLMCLDGCASDGKRSVTASKEEEKRKKIKNWAVGLTASTFALTIVCLILYILVEKKTRRNTTSIGTLSDDDK